VLDSTSLASSTISPDLDDVMHALAKVTACARDRQTIPAHRSIHW
jgi:hypothetical protein